MVAAVAEIESWPLDTPAVEGGCYLVFCCVGHASAIRYDLNYGPTYLLIPQGDVTRVTDDCLALLYSDLEDDLQLGDVIEETYTGTASQALRDYLDSLPSALYYEEDSGCVSESEPQGYLDSDSFDFDMAYYLSELDSDSDSDIPEPDESDYWCDLEPYYALDLRDIVRILFGSTIASEFR
jgi:hypothetical protein